MDPNVPPSNYLLLLVHFDRGLVNENQEGSHCKA